MNVKIEVYDTISKQMVEIEVSEEFAAEYKRMIWRNEKQDQSFYNHHIQASMLNNSNDNDYENYHEFIVGDEFDAADAVAIRNTYLYKLKRIINTLPDKDIMIIKMLFVKNMSERECAKALNCSQVNIHKMKSRILCRLNKLLRNE